MSTINPAFGARIHRYAPAQPAAPAQAPAETAAASSSANVRSTRGAAPADGLSAAEQRMIDRYFPPSETMALRLYSPGGTRTAYPAAVGGRLDLRG